MLKFLLSSLIVCNIAFASTLIECRVVTEDFNECNPYTSKYLYTQEIKYDQGRKKLISSKVLPHPEKKAMLKVVSVEETAAPYKLSKESLRFKGGDSIAFGVEDITVDGEILRKEGETAGRRIVIRTKEELEKYLRELQQYEKELQEMEKEEQIGIYKVKSGDMLSRIAKKFNMKTSVLRKFNGLKKGSILRIGQKLKVPLTQEMVDAISTARYKIKEGDSLISIAKKFDLTVQALAEFNKIKKNATIRIGKVLELPLPHRLAQKYSVYGNKTLRVTATAYTSHAQQTDSTPFLAAWNNRLVPGMKIIAVSRDLLSAYGMRNGTKVRIAGLPGIYRVRDKMNKRYRKRIDIYMGLDRNRALRWGRRSVKIYWD